MFIHSVSSTALRNQSFACKDASMTLRSRRLVRLMDNIIQDRAKYDPESQRYQLCYDELYSIEQEELTAELFIEEPDYVAEASGPDNDDFESKMAPSLIKLLKNSTNAEARLNFIESWVAGASAYAKAALSDLLQWRLQQFNLEV